MSPPALELRDLHKRLGQTDILCGLSLSLIAGERMALIGPNGAGKSTLFNLISGRTRADSGQVLLHGQRIDGKKPFQIQRLGLSRSFQISKLFAQLSVFDHLRCSLLWSLGYRYTFWRRLSSLHEVNAQAQASLRLFGLESRRDVRADQLSHAEQRALEVGLALGGNARVVLLDEPTAGMSKSETQHFIGLIRQATHGKTLLLVEHDMDVVFELADRIAVLAQGKLLALDTPAAVRANPQVQQAYLGAHRHDPPHCTASKEPGVITVCQRHT